MLTHSRFRVVDNVMGWIVFFAASIVYCSTAEPSASLWDCSEFIISAYKLEVGHPPGAPFYMLVANLFGQLASSPAEVAKMVNILSALLSAGCVLFLFWSISHLMRLLLHVEQMNWSTLFTIEGAALVGSLAFCFSDSFWYSAVEAEVYAFSSFLTALVFWLMLKWEEAEPGTGNRWILLICYLMGLSIGVHLLNLLCIPSMVLIYYFRRSEKTSAWGIIKALFIGFALLGGLLYGLVPGVLWLAERAELLAVNCLSLPFNSGLLAFIGLLLIVIAWGLIVLKGKKRLFLKSVALILAGFSCYGIILIRSAANTPMDENSPEDVFALKRYLNREQYGETPLLYGPTYKSRPLYERKGNYSVIKKKEGAMQYQKSETDGKYKPVGRKEDYIYEKNQLFPRMHSVKHARAYEQWMGGVKDASVRENLRFFFSYQLYYMYIRYFFWNFVGRQNDIPGNGEAEYGNWITGIDWVDSWLLGCDMDKLPSELSGNAGRNVYYALPLLLGILGMVWQYRQRTCGKQQFCVIATLFFMTGIAIVLYLNQTPLQARERDYSYAGSFYAFSIWIGLGVGAMTRVISAISRRCKVGNHCLSAIVGILLCLSVPILMALQNWDDHNRGHRYACRDFGLNYLNSAQSEGYPIIFSLGDNDTFPLWYHQEVEGNRTDTRVCNLSYACIDWYVEQMLRPAYDSPALPLGWEEKDYKWGANAYVQIEPEIAASFMSLYEKEPATMERVFGKAPFELKNILKHWVFERADGMSDEDIRLRKYVKALVCGREHEWQTADIRCFPTDSTYVSLPDGRRMNLSLAEEKLLLMNDLLLLQLLSDTTINRPLYVTTSMDLNEISYIKPHLSLEGLLYKVVPACGEGNSIHVNTDVMFDNVMNKLKFGGLESCGIYADYDVRKMLYAHQQKMAMLVDALMREGDMERALSVVRKWQNDYPQEYIMYDRTLLVFAECLYLTGNMQEADEIVENLLVHSAEWLEWCNAKTNKRRNASGYTEYVWLKTMNQSLTLVQEHTRTHLLEIYFPLYKSYLTSYEQFFK